MTKQVNQISTVIEVAEFNELFGLPPVLKSESTKAYNEILAKLLKCLGPRDFLEQILIRDVADSTWDVIRYRRHKVLSIERKGGGEEDLVARNRRWFARSFEAWEKVAASIPESQRKTKPEDFGMEGWPPAHQVPQEPDYVQALQETIDYHERLDQLHDAAMARRIDALDALERYREGLGQAVCRSSDDIIDAEFSVEPQPGQIEASLQPGQIEGALVSPEAEVK